MVTVLPLLYVALSFQLGAALPSTPADNHSREISLLHRAISSANLRDLNVWDQRYLEWRAAKPDELADDRASVLLLHFWAPWCKPCIEEFPIWRELGPRLEALHKGKVRVLYVAVQTSQSDMEHFLTANKDRMPPAPWYLDVGERLSAVLRADLPDEQLPMPMTLWLDRQRAVRQALVGSIKYRRREVVDSTARLLRLVEQLDRPAQPTKPTGAARKAP